MTIHKLTISPQVIKALRGRKAWLGLELRSYSDPCLHPFSHVGGGRPAYCLTCGKLLPELDNA